MVPSKDRAKPVKTQAERSYRGREWQCLLKGCEGTFQPQRRQQRYCGPACVEAARAWSLWKGRGRWRESASGRLVRNAGNGRYRRRRAARESASERSGNRSDRGGGEIAPTDGADGSAAHPGDGSAEVTGVLLRDFDTRSRFAMSPLETAADVPAQMESNRTSLVVGPALSPASGRTIEAPALAESIAALAVDPAVSLVGGCGTAPAFCESDPRLRDGIRQHPRGSSVNEKSCDRPGCYELFDLTRRSPAQRFCARPCRRALERIWQRESRWRRRHRVAA